MKLGPAARRQAQAVLGQRGQVLPPLQPVGPSWSPQRPRRREPRVLSSEQLLARPGVVLAVLGTPDAGTAKIMEAAGVEAAFIGTSITGGRYTGLGDTGLITRDRSAVDRQIHRRRRQLPDHPRRRHGSRRAAGGAAPGARMHHDRPGRHPAGRPGHRGQARDAIGRHRDRLGASKRWSVTAPRSTPRNELDPDFVDHGAVLRARRRQRRHGRAAERAFTSTRPRAAPTGCSSSRRIRQTRSSRRERSSKAPLSAMRGKLPKTLTMEEHAELGPQRGLVHGLAQHRDDERCA